MTQIKPIVVDELEALLLDVAPDEADTAALYFEDPSAYTGRAHEEIAGVPGGGTIMLLAPMLVPWLAAIVTQFLLEFQKQGVESSTKAAVGWLARFFKPKPLAATREETVTQIFTSLINLGLRADEAGAIAEKVWARGERAASRATSQAL